MTANFNRGPNTPTESTILSKIESSIDMAVSELNLPLQQQAHVKRQKYTFLVIRHFSDEQDPPVTYSWFKWGVSCKAGPSSMHTSQPLLAPEPKAKSILDVDVHQIDDFLREDINDLALDEWWEADHLDFLEQFYTHYGPDFCREIYLANIKLLRIMSAISDAIQYRRSPARPATVEDISETSNDLNNQILTNNYLSEYARYVTTFTQLLETVVASLVELDEDDIERGHETVMSELIEFYRDHVWMIIAHSISRYTAVGPNAGLIRSDSEKSRESLIAKFDEAFRLNQRRCQAMGLLSAEEEPPAFEDLTRQNESDDPTTPCQSQRSDLSQGMDKRQREAIAAFKEVDLEEK